MGKNDSRVWGESSDEWVKGEYSVMGEGGAATDVRCGAWLDTLIVVMVAVVVVVVVVQLRPRRAWKCGEHVSYEPDESCSARPRRTCGGLDSEQWSPCFRRAVSFGGLARRYDISRERTDMNSG